MSKNAKPMTNVKYTLAPGAVAPEYQSAGASGADLSYDGRHGALAIRPGHVSLIPTGVSIELKPGYEAQVRSRSGLAAKGFYVLNSPGTIDTDYRGEIVVIMTSVKDVWRVTKGERVAQLVISPVVQAQFDSAPELEATERGSDGLGSTGV